MNWIEIDVILHGIIKRHDALDDIYIEAEKQFKWTRSQSMIAIDPLIKRLEWSPNGRLCIKAEPDSADISTTGRRRKVRDKSKTARK